MPPENPLAGSERAHVVRVAVVDIALTGACFVFVVFEGAGANLGRDLLVGIGLGILLAHDDRQVGLKLAQCVNDEAVWFLEDDFECLVVLGAGIGDPAEHVLGGCVAGGPAAQRGHAVG